MDISERVQAGLLGSAVGEAIGVPFKYSSRAALKTCPVTDMVEPIEYRLPLGTWSEATSLSLAIMESLVNHNMQLNCDNIMNHFCEWYNEGRFTAVGYAFDINRTNYLAIRNYLADNPTDDVARSAEFDGSDGKRYVAQSWRYSLFGNMAMDNGALKRMLPIAIYIYARRNKYDNVDWDLEDDVTDVIKLTHAYKTNIVGCKLHYFIVIELMKGTLNLDEAVMQAFHNSDLYGYPEFYRLMEDTWQAGSMQPFSDLPEDEIYSTDSIVDTLEAAIWSLLNTNDYVSAVLKAVNLGGATDSIGAIVGGLAGLVYGLDSIPKKWINSLQRKVYLEEKIDFFEENIAHIEKNRK